MNFKIISFFLFLLNSYLGNLVSCNDYKREYNFINIYNSYKIDYNQSSIYNNSNNNSKNNILETNVGFSNGMKDYNINNINKINKLYNISHDKCLLNCNDNIKCLGVFEYEKNNINVCNLLPIINKPIFYNETTYSWLKIYENKNDDRDYSISGTVYDSFNDNNDNIYYNHTKIYIDLNHNGILDNDEIYIKANI